MISESVTSHFSSGSLWLALIGLALATLLSEDLTCIGAGLLVAGGKAPFWPVLIACMIGIFLGDILLVAIGRTLGRPLLDMPLVRRRVAPERIERAERWFKTKGGRLVLATRFMPGIRLPAYLAAGMLRVPWMPFIGWFALGCVLWTPLLVGATVWAGETLLTLFRAWERTVPLLLGAGVLIWALLKLGIRLASWRGRRLLLSRWRRLTRWEFWPSWAVYPPVIAYVLILGLRHRCLTVFTAVNPSLGANAGLLGASKAEYLLGLSGIHEGVARWTTIEPGKAADRADAVGAFMNLHGLKYPVVLKPDIGEGGEGVVIARNRQAVLQKVTDDDSRLIAQDYIEGVEFGVFYLRHPAETCGHIFAITDKRRVSVQGDGVRTLEELILFDDRAVCMAGYFLEKFASRLDDVPAVGESVVLSDLGTQRDGAVFLDGRDLETPALREAIDRISRTFSGFYFGRYDVVSADAAAFQRGEFTIIELSGLGSAPTSMYDPRHSVWHGWRQLFRQWRWAFRIGAANRKLGARVLALRQVWQLFG